MNNASESSRSGNREPSFIWAAIGFALFIAAATLICLGAGFMFGAGGGMIALGIVFILYAVIALVHFNSELGKS